MDGGSVDVRGLRLSASPTAVCLSPRCGLGYPCGLNAQQERSPGQSEATPRVALLGQKVDYSFVYIGVAHSGRMGLGASTQGVALGYGLLPLRGVSCVTPQFYLVGRTHQIFYGIYFG